MPGKRGWGASPLGQAAHPPLLGGMPPFCSDYGRVQRRLAAAHGVTLIPKRWLADVLTADGATVDGIHLSQEGHERMAEKVWRLLAPAYRERAASAGNDLVA